MEQTATTSQLVYVVDDDVAIARLVTGSLLERGYRVKQFSGGNEALTSLQSDRPDLIVLDLLMPDSDGIEMTKTIRQHSQVPILVLGMRDATAATIAALDLNQSQGGNYILQRWQRQGRCKNQCIGLSL